MKMLLFPMVFMCVLIANSSFAADEDFSYLVGKEFKLKRGIDLSQTYTTPTKLRYLSGIDCTFLGYGSGIGAGESLQITHADFHTSGMRTVDMTMIYKGAWVDVQCTKESLKDAATGTFTPITKTDVLKTLEQIGTFVDHQNDGLSGAGAVPIQALSAESKAGEAKISTASNKANDPDSQARISTPDISRAAPGR